MLREQLVGTWKLVSYTERDHPSGPARYPHGPDAIGLIIYTADGYMSAQIMTQHRPLYDRPTPNGGTTEQAATGYLAYSGPYTVDEATGDVQHDVTVSLLPNWLNQPQLRHSHLQADRLTLTAESPQPDGTTLLSTLKWVRAATGE